MRGRKKGPTRREKGQATVEFALVVVMVLITLFGIVDFSRLFFAYATMSNGVREGARFGITYQDREDEEAMKQAIEHKAQAMMVLIGGEAEIDVDFPGQDDGSEPGCKEAHYCRLVVTATSNLNVWTPVLPSMEIVAQATMHFE